MATATSVLPRLPLYLQATGGDPSISYSAADFRLILGSIYGRTGPVLNGMRVTQRAAGANMSVDVGTGFAIVGNSASEVERYLVRVDASTNIPMTGFATAPGATRNHKLWLAVYNKAVVGTEYTSKIVITEDVGAGAPAPADNPAYTVELATLQMTSAATTMTNARITHTARKAAPGSGIFALPLVDNTIEATTGGPPRYSVNGSTLTLSGCLSQSTGNFLNNNAYNIGLLPAGYRPRYLRYAIGTGYVNYNWRLSVDTDGLMIAAIPSTNPISLEFISLDNIHIELD